VPDTTHGGIYHVPAIDPVIVRAVTALLAAAEEGKEGTPRLAPAEAAPHKAGFVEARDA
jgi:hypothetical protein